MLVLSLGLGNEDQVLDLDLDRFGVAYVLEISN